MTDPGSYPPPPPGPPPGDLYGGPPAYGGPPPSGPPFAGPAPLPWEDRQRLGFFPALIETIKLLVTKPAEAFARARESGDYLSPILFAVIVGWVMTIIGQMWSLLFQSSWIAMLPPEMRDQIGPMMATGGASFLIAVILAPVFILIGLFIWSGILHLFVMMLGAHKQSSSGFEGTFRAVSYSYVSSLAQVIPLVGGLIALVWNIVLMVIGLVRMHRTTQGKAVGAVLLPIALCCVCVIVVMIFAIGSLAAAFSNMQ